MASWLCFVCLLSSGWQEKKAPGPVRAVAFLPSGNQALAAWGNQVLVISTKDGVKIQQFTPGLPQVNALAVSPDGKAAAIAHGKPGAKGVLQLHQVNGAALEPKPVWTRDLHTDLVHALAFSPDNKWIVSCGYDRSVRISLAATGELVRELKDHSDAVNAVGFSFCGKFFASTGADRAIKIWDTQSWKKIHTLNEPTDGVLCLAWHPGKNLLAAGGSDQVLRVYQCELEQAKLAHSAFAHSSPVVKLVWNEDGTRIITAGQDRVWKVWDASKLNEIAAYPQLSDTPHCLAIQPKTGAVAIGRQDGKLDLFDAKTGKSQRTLIPFPVAKAVLRSFSPGFIAAGAKAKVLVQTADFLLPMKVESSNPQVKVSLLPGDIVGAFSLEVFAEPGVKPGAVSIRVKNNLEQEIALSLEIDRFPRHMENEPNDSRLAGQVLPFPFTVSGAIQRAGDSDWYVVEARAGQEIAIQIQSEKEAGAFFPILQLVDDRGIRVAETANGWLTHVCQRAGPVALEVRDREFRGGPAAGNYRLHVGAFPLVTGVFPLGWKKGETVAWHLQGVGLPGANPRPAAIPNTTADGARVSVESLFPGMQTVPGLVVIASSLPEVLPAKGIRLPVPGVANGQLSQDQPVHAWPFQASKGKRILLEVESTRLGSPMDSFLEVLAADGQPVASFMLRGLAKTSTIFRDNDSQIGTIRIESWNDLAINDFILLGTELMRIRELPRGPDDDCRFFTAAGKRQAYLGTTPTHHYLGQAMYKVSIHPPGMVFPPNGLPQATLFYQNDDGGNGFDKDSKIVFDPPADGAYFVRIRDIQGRSGPNFSYRLRARHPSPDFNLRVSPQDPKPALGEGVTMNIDIDRTDDFDSPVTVEVQGLPAGFHAPKVLVSAGETSANFALFADANAKNPLASQGHWKLIATAKNGQAVVKKEITLKPPQLGQGGDLFTTTAEKAVLIPSGGQGKLLVHIERKNGFTGRVPVDVRGLPHGARVLDVGLNGILITPRETQRTIVIQVDSWVEPGEYPFVVLSRQEGKNREFAARTVMLQVPAK